jgi:hypothetical protein
MDEEDSKPAAVEKEKAVETHTPVGVWNCGEGKFSTFNFTVTKCRSHRV